MIIYVPFWVNVLETVWKQCYPFLVDFLFLYIICVIYYHVTIQIKSLQRIKLAIFYFLAIYYEEIPLSRGSSLALTKLLIA